MLSSLLKSLISLKVHTRSKKVAKYVFQETNNYQRQGRYDTVSPFDWRALQWNMTKYVYNNAVPYRSSHHLPVTVERNTHTQSNARTLHLKWSLLALHMGQHPNLLRLQRRRLSQFIGNQFMGNPINPHLLEKKRKFLLKTTVQLPQDYTRRFGTPTWSPLYC